MAQIGEFYDIKTAAADDQSAAAQWMTHIHFQPPLYQIALHNASILLK